MWGALFAVARLVVILIGLAFLSVSAAVVYRLFLHPLSRVPGPKLAAVSNIWHGVQVRNGRSRLLGQTLHKRYGPVVRVGPNEVWFDSAEAFKQIYRMYLFYSHTYCFRKASPVYARDDYFFR